MQTRIVLHGVNRAAVLQALEKNFSGKQVDIKEITDGTECVFEDSCEARKAVNSAVREYIVNFCEENEIKKIINRQYSFFNPEEKKLLGRNVKKAIDNEEDIHEQLFVMRRNRIIEKETAEYFAENKKLNLEGFLPFRLQLYTEELGKLIEYNADAFVMRREYEEFLSLLKTYISMQPSGVEKLNVVVAENREYIYYDKRGRNISKMLEMENCEDVGREIESDDLLINILISKNPKTVILHNREFMKKEVADTINAIFEGRCRICEGCRLCGK